MKLFKENNNMNIYLYLKQKLAKCILSASDKGHDGYMHWTVTHCSFHRNENMAYPVRNRCRTGFRNLPTIFQYIVMNEPHVSNKFMLRAVELNEV